MPIGDRDRAMVEVSSAAIIPTKKDKYGSLTTIGISGISRKEIEVSRKDMHNYLMSGSVSNEFITKNNSEL